MSAKSAEEFFYKYIYGNIAKEDELRQTRNDEEFINKIIFMANEADWPTGPFKVRDIKEAGNAHALENIELYAPYETVIHLLREKKIGGCTNVY